ncbi:MAG TPA: helix-turn-helix transcriptional regulator [Gaiellaceae bacterium]|nr:helix-turn-helix transcriptional regulator [Gaiellaceae bacterium]
MAAPHYHSHVDDPRAVGERLRAARVAAGLSQRQLAFPGCSAAYISRLEAGDRVPSLQLLRKLAVKLGADENYLATGVAGPRERPNELVEAEIALRLDDVDRADALYDRVLKTAPAAEARAEALAGLGRVAYRRGDPRAAVASLEEALDVDAAATLASPTAMETLGRAYATIGELECAIGAFERALAHAREREDAPAAAKFSILLANALIDNGRFGRAEELLGGAVADLGAEADPAARARLYWSQSRLHTLKGNHDAAARYARRTLELLELTEDTHYLARAQQLLGFIELERGNPAAALEVLRSGRASLGDAADPILVAQFRLEEARALAALGEREEAAAEAAAVAGLLADADPHDAARSYAVLARVYADLGEIERAVELYELAAELLENTSNPYVAEVYEALGRLFEAQGRGDDALQLLKRALEARQQAHAPS